MEKESRKRPRTLEDLVNAGQYTFLDRGVAMELLMRVDAQDAMKFAATMGIDRRYHTIVELLREEEIWRYWFKRDLDIFDVPAEQFLPWSVDSKPIESPQWKTVYLWYRLVITGLQWAFLDFSYERIMKAYPPNSQLRLVRLNLLEFTPPRESAQYRDFREDFVRMVREVQGFRLNRDASIAYSFKNMDFFIRFNIPERFLPFLENWYPKMLSAQRERIIIYLGQLYREEQKYISYDDEEKDKLLNRVPGIFSLQLELLNRPPRLIEETKLLVAAPLCLTCDSPASHHERGAPQRTFCSGKCQAAFYQ